MSARFTAVALIVASAWYGCQWHAGTLPMGRAVLRVLACAFVAGAIGKVVGLLEFHARAARASRQYGPDGDVAWHRRYSVGHHEE
jgi:hypothetical protein